MCAVGSKSVNLSEQMENNYLSGGPVLNGHIAVFLVVLVECSLPQAAQFFESRFYPLSGRREAK